MKDQQLREFIGLLARALPYLISYPDFQERCGEGVQSWYLVLYTRDEDKGVGNPAGGKRAVMSIQEIPDFKVRVKVIRWLQAWRTGAQ